MDIDKQRERLAQIQRKVRHSRIAFAFLFLGFILAKLAKVPDGVLFVGLGIGIIVVGAYWVRAY
ncbi:MAG TPA: hypothetical protein VN418_05120, partial [Gammaproteobacteria bacterium]|nr:hypothetical protein [Gammaproteobacteria bacterium]